MNSDVIVWKGYSPDTVTLTFDVFKHLSIKQIAVGVNHYLFLTSKHTVYSYGQNDCGQLGLGLETTEVDQPVEITFLADKHIEKIECGFFHSAAVSTDGTLYTWGYNSDGQCGTGDFDTISTPKVVEFPPNSSCDCKLGKCDCDYRVRAISCGRKHTLVVMSDGALWCFGSGIALGLAETEHTCLPVVVERLKHRKVLSVSCGEAHSCVVVAKEEQMSNRTSSLNSSFDSPVVCSQCNRDMFKMEDTTDLCIVSNERHCCSDESQSPGFLDSQETVEKLRFDSVSDAATTLTENSLSDPFDTSHSSVEVVGDIPKEEMRQPQQSSDLKSSLVDVGQAVMKFSMDLRSFFEIGMGTSKDGPSKQSVSSDSGSEKQDKENMDNLQNEAKMTSLDHERYDTELPSAETTSGIGDPPESDVSFTSSEPELEETQTINDTILNESEIIAEFTGNLNNGSEENNSENCDIAADNEIMYESNSSQEMRTSSQTIVADTGQQSQISCDNTVLNTAEKDSRTSATQAQVHNEQPLLISDQPDATNTQKHSAIVTDDDPSIYSVQTTDNTTPEHDNNDQTTLEMDTVHNQQTKGLTENLQQDSIVENSAQQTLLEKTHRAVVEYPQVEDTVEKTGENSSHMRTLTDHPLSEDRLSDFDLSPGQSKVDRALTFVDEDRARKFLAKQFDDEKNEGKFQMRSFSLVDNKTAHNFSNLSLSQAAAKTKINKSDTAVKIPSRLTTQVSLEMTSPRSKLDKMTSISRLDKNVSMENPHLAETSFKNHDSLSSDASFNMDFESLTSDLFLGDENSLNLQRPRSVAIRKEALANRDKAEKSSNFKDSGNVSEPIVIDTEVWTWGKNSQGQLGQGHTIDVTQPTIIKMLKNRNIVHISTGANHTLAVTADNQVYSWGHNSCGQLGQTDTNETPTKVKSLLESPVWSIASGGSHSLFLVDTTGFQPEVYYAGKQPSDDIYSSAVKTTQPAKLHFLKKHGWVHSIAAKGDHCAALSCADNSGFLATRFEFLSSERKFYSRLKKALANFLLPLRKTEFYVAGEQSLVAYRTCCHAVLSGYSSLANQIGRNIQELTSHLQRGDDVLHASFFDETNICLEELTRYSTALSDLIALDGISLTAKYSSHFIEKTKAITDELLEILSKRLKLSHHDTFIKVLQLPLQRVSDYLKFATKITPFYTTKSPEHVRITKFTEKMDNLVYNLVQEQVQANITRSFWENCSSRFVDHLRKPSRRLVRDSKTNNLSLQQNLRLSTHTFYLFNDIFVHHQVSNLRIYPLETVWVEATLDDNNQSTLTMVTPEEVLTLFTNTAAEKAEWLSVFNQTINKALDRSCSEHVTPSLTRRGTYTFQKSGELKDAKYRGAWLDGMMHGEGELEWPDLRKYIGKFHRGQQHGYGVFITPHKDGVEMYRGMWKDGSYHGYGHIKYANGDSYEGYFKKNMRFGHGVYSQGHHVSGSATVYIGEWAQDLRHGYGVMDDVLKGEKYMGMWEDNCRHGNGIVVTLDGMYFEGQFLNNKLTGFGLMLTDDNSYYEGDFNGITQLYGKGKLTLPGGDYIEGQFNGSWNDGLKINGTFSKVSSMYGSLSKASLGRTEKIQSECYGKLSVSAGRKWSDIFSHCRSILGYHGTSQSDVTDRAWEMVAVIMSASRRQADAAEQKKPRRRQASINLECLEKIPPHNLGSLTHEYYTSITQYLSKAFDTKLHPLGKLMACLVDVFRATYIGIGAHPRLLHHASLEVKSYVRRTYAIVRILFPDLPKNGGPVSLKTVKADDSPAGSANQNAPNDLNVMTADPTHVSVEVVTAGSLLHPILLPRIYPALFDLYALYNDMQDEIYWERVVKLNRQGDVALMAYLGIHEKFWLLDDSIFKDKKQQKLSSVKDYCYSEAVDTLQQMSTAFCPSEKLEILKQTFTEISNAVRESLGANNIWCMDELFPIFQLVVIRSKMQHLGAEIQLIEDLMEKHVQNGVLGIMFTTLKACYFQIQTEKIPNV